MEDVFILDSYQANQLTENKNWIEDLFRVRLVLETDSIHDPDLWRCTITSTGKNAQEILIKAKKYISALTEEPEAQLTLKDVNYVTAAVNFKEEIEKTFTTALVISDDFKFLNIRGDEQNVNITERVLGKIIQWSNAGKDLAVFPFGDVVDQCVQEAHSSLLDDTNWNVNLDSEDVSVSALPLEFNHLHLASDLHNESSTDDEDFVNDIKRDPLYQNKVDFAIKLGYLECDLLDALKTLGKDASQNELLSELIKSNASREESGQGLGDLSSRSQSSFEDDQLEEVNAKILEDDPSPFRHIIIDGSNVAMSHGNKEVFSCRGIQLAVDWFQERGHTNINVFVPQWRKETPRSDTRIRDQHVLTDLERDGILVFTPSRRIGGKRVVCYDDRYVLKLAVDTDGIVVSNDNYRDLMTESDKFKKVVEERLLMYSFVNDRFMPPDDPLGRNGPTLENFLLKKPAEPEPLPPQCPYGSKKCTYGNKCKYYHPERRTQPHKPVTEKLAEQAKQRKQEIRQKEVLQQQASLPGEKKQLRRAPLGRTKSANPDDMSKSPLTFSFGAPKEPDDYNQKLTESRLKMEQERGSEKVKLASPRGIEKRELQRSKTTDDQAGQCSPRFMDLRQEGVRSPREASPVNLSVPDKTDTSQKFLSGHLLLAKKLSDEANETDKMKVKSKTKGPGDPFSSITMSPLAYSPSKPAVEPGSKKQPLQRSKEKQSVSRQVSLQGSDDPRLAPSHRHLPLHASLSFDPRSLASHQAMYGNREDRQLMLNDFQKVQHQELSSNFYGPIEPPSHRMVKDLSHGHATVTRMQSAPDTFILSKPSGRQPPLMMRQNSSSDTQLNKLYTGEHEPFGMEALLSHGAADNTPTVMQDTTGSIKFQIGSVQGQPMQAFKQPAFHGPMYSHNSTPDFRSQQQFPTEFPPPQQHNTQFISMQPPPPQQHPNSQTPQAKLQSVFHPGQFTEQGNIWEPNQPHSNNFGTQPQFQPSSMWPTMPQSNQGLIPTNFNTPLNQSHQLGPNPIENPILPSDRRFELYCNLCRLFPEEQVRAVMNQHPTTDNPNEICAYLINNK